MCPNSLKAHDSSGGTHSIASFPLQIKEWGLRELARLSQGFMLEYEFPLKLYEEPRKKLYGTVLKIFSGLETLGFS